MNAGPATVVPGGGVALVGVRIDLREVTRFSRVVFMPQAEAEALRLQLDSSIPGVREEARAVLADAMVDYTGDAGEVDDEPEVLDVALSVLPDEEARAIWGRVQALPGHEGG